MNQDNVDKLLKCRAAIDNFRQASLVEADRITAYAEMLNVVQSAGFATLQDYDAWDKEMCVEARKESRPILGTCDGCPHLSVPPCVTKYGAEKACVSSKQGQGASDEIYRIAWKAAGEGSQKQKDGIVRLICPEGHGYYLDESKVKEPPFDYKWRLYP